MTLKYFKYLLIFATVFFGCKKRLFDYRNKYWGTWEFNYSIHSCNYFLSPSCTDQTGKYTGKIYYDKKHGQKNEIIIEFSPGTQKSYQIDKNGKIGGTGINGKFPDEQNISLIDSLGLGFVSGGSTVLTYSYTITGTKK